MIERVNLNDLNLRQIAFIAFIVFFSTISYIYINNFQAKARDVKRKADLANIIKALDLYHEKYGVYPESADERNGWDMSNPLSGKGPGVLTILAREELISRVINDPVNNENYQYLYKKFPAESYGCRKPFYIFQILNFETEMPSRGSGRCKEFDWTKLAPYGFTTQGFD